MKTKLLPTQQEDVRLLSRTVDLPNFSEPGTGKTITTIAAIEWYGFKHGIIVCPPVACLMWKQNLEHELDAKVQWLKGRSTPIDRDAEFWVMSYSVVASYVQEFLAEDWKIGYALVVDESHQVKNPDALRTTALFGLLGDGDGGLYQKSLQCWLLTGTPIERYADDLWSQLRATHPDTLAKFNAETREDFQRQFCRMRVMEYDGGAVEKYVSVGNQNEKLLNTMLYNPTVGIGAIRRTIDEVEANMPPVTFREVSVGFDVFPELKSLLKGKSVEEIEDLLKNGDEEILQARRLVGIGKAPYVAKYVREALAGKQVLIGYWHKEVGTGILKALDGAGTVDVGLIEGGTPSERRELLKQRFMNGSCRILIGQIHAMGVAMDGLQVASNHVVFAERDWSWAKMEQFYKRLYRKGQRRHVQVDFCEADVSIDDALRRVNQVKRVGTEQIIG